MSLTIYNTMTRKKEPFQSLQPDKVTMYVCGPTVYDLLHVGNFRGVIFFNLVRNWLQALGYEVTYTYNFTDIDDKIIKRAQEENVSSTEISSRYIQAFEEDFAALDLTPHDYTPKATEYIPQMIKEVERLIAAGAAYEVEGEVFYSIDQFSEYGKLSCKNLEELEAGHRVEVDKKKRAPMDFVLWKPSKENEPKWPSPWGEGRPGWHLECSTMIHAIMGESIDIHGGGIDLIFPHHENEIAQSEAVTNKQFVRYWMHNNFIKVNDEKMSKSLGNTIKARDFIKKYHPEIFKYLILSVHYRSLLNISPEQIENSIMSVARVYSALQLADEILAKNIAQSQQDAEFIKFLEQAENEITQALNDDFNTPKMMASIFNVVRKFNFSLSKKKKSPADRFKAESFKEWLTKQGKLLALFQQPAKKFLRDLDYILLQDMAVSPEEIEQLVAERTQARATKNFKRSDEIRHQLAQMGIEVHDSPEGTTWEVKKQVGVGDGE